MPRDIVTPLTTARFPASTLRYASARRAEFFSILNSLSLARRWGPKPYDVKLRAMNERNLRSAGRLAAAVLP